MNNIQTVREVYEAFGRGDVPAILARVTDRTEWGFEARGSEVPWHKPVAGKEALPAFFGALGENVDMKVFEPRLMLADGAHVVARIHLEFVVRKTGKSVSMDQLHLWAFDGEGRISSMRHFEDTAQVQRAWGG
jgi:uncharacterized protein